MNEEQKELVDILKESIDMVYNEEPFLFDFSDGPGIGLERPFVARTIVYLDSLVKESRYCKLSLDSEYNKHLGSKKILEEFPEGIRPDLILHERNSDKCNILAVEFKGHWETNINALERDLSKLKGLTNPAEPYHYFLGIFVEIGKTKASFRYFIDGTEHIE